MPQVGVVLQMDRNLTTKHWDKRFNLGVLGVICIDANLFFQQVVHVDNRTTSCLKFLGMLADKLINNQEGICLTWAAADQDVGGVVDTAAAAVSMVRRTICCKPHGKRIIIEFREDADARAARSILSMSVAHAHMPPIPPRSSSGSATPRWWRGASALSRTLARDMLPRHTKTIRTRGRGSATGGGSTTMTTTTTTMMEDKQQIHKQKIHIVCLFFYISCCAMEATQRHANP
jgi:hypothetical protein